MTGTELDAAGPLPALAATLPGHGRNPYWIYLARLDSAESRRTMKGCLDRLAVVLIPGTASAANPGEAVPWWQIRYENAVPLRTLIAAQTASTGECWSDSHVNKHLAALRGVITESWNLGYINADDRDRIVKGAKNIKGTRVPAGRSIHVGETVRLLAACTVIPGMLGVRDAAIIAVLQSTGARRAEVAALRIDRYDAAERCAKVTGKGNKEREVYLHNEAVPYLDAWLALLGERRGPMFRSVDRWGNIGGRPLSARAVGLIVEQRRDMAGLPPLSAHDYRRSFIGDLLDKGVDLVTVQELVGHASPATTARYDRRPGQKRRAAVDKLTLTNKEEDA